MWERVIATRVLVPFAFVLFALTGCERRLHWLSDVPTDAHWIARGEEASGSEDWSRSVVAIVKLLPSGAITVVCSGTLIGHSEVLTAAHCVDGENDLSRASNQGVFISFGLVAGSDSTQLRPAVRTAKHPNYFLFGDDISDIGLVEFSGGIPFGFGPAELLDDPAVLTGGKEVLVAGFGATEASSDSDTSGRLRFGRVTISDPQYGQHEISTNERQSTTCIGDSGGPAFVFYQGKHKLWGVTSRGDRECRSHGIYTRIDVFSDWLETSLM